MSSESFPWYGLAVDGWLEQGDLLNGCTILRENNDGTIAQDKTDAIVVSHSCDLANDKLEFVQVCPLWTLENLATQIEYLKARKGREDLRRGNLPGYHLLNRCELPGLESDLLVVDFRSLCGISISSARQLAGSQTPRCRLLPPYREHLAQAFARFFMRVGLPIDIPAFGPP